MLTPHKSPEYLRAANADDIRAAGLELLEHRDMHNGGVWVSFAQGKEWRWASGDSDADALNCVRSQIGIPVVDVPMMGRIDASDLKTITWEDGTKTECDATEPVIVSLWPVSAGSQPVTSDDLRRFTEKSLDQVSTFPNPPTVPNEPFTIGNARSADLWGTGAPKAVSLETLLKLREQFREQSKPLEDEIGWWPVKVISGSNCNGFVVSMMEPINGVWTECREMRYYDVMAVSSKSIRAEIKPGELAQIRTLESGKFEIRAWQNDGTRVAMPRS